MRKMYSIKYIYDNPEYLFFNFSCLKKEVIKKSNRVYLFMFRRHQTVLKKKMESTVKGLELARRCTT